MTMSRKTSNDDESIERETESADGPTFLGEYNAFGVYGKTTSDPTTLVWVEGHEHERFGLHHPYEYGVAEVFGWLVNNVLHVEFGDVPAYALDQDVRIAVKRAPEQEPEYIAAEDVEAWTDE